VYALIPKDQRADYLQPFKQLHAELLAFNRAVGQNQRESAVAAARQALPHLDKLLDIADKETPDEIAAKNKEGGE
jgi:hypothetical protein